MDLPPELWAHIVSFEMRDRDQRSPTADVVRGFLGHHWFRYYMKWREVHGRSVVVCDVLNIMVELYERGYSPVGEVDCLCTSCVERVQTARALVLRLIKTSHRLAA